METIGQVIELYKDNNTAKVAVIRPSACGENCAMCKGCQLTSNTCVVKNEVNANIGDKVKISIESSTVLWAAFTVYGLPLLIFLTVYCILISFTRTNIAIGGSILAFLLSFVFLFVLDRKLKKTNRIQSKAVKILN